MNYCIYKHTSPSGKSYIGLTNNYRKRTNKHKLANGECSSFHGAIKKYGWGNFTHEILEDNLSLDDANIKEAFYIAELKTISPLGYNLTSGWLACSPSEETRAKISLSSTGRIKTLETREKLSLALKGKQRPKIVIEKIIKTKKERGQTEKQLNALLLVSQSNIGRVRSKDTLLKMSQCRIGKTGKPHSKDAKDKMSLARKGVPKSEEHKRKIAESAKKRYAEKGQSIFYKKADKV